MKIIYLFIILFLPIFFGGVIARPFHNFRGISGFLASGTVTGLTVFVTLAYLFALSIGKINCIGIILALLVMGGCSVGLFFIFRDDRKVPVDEPENPLATRMFCLVVLGILSCILILSTTEILRIDDHGYFIGFEKNLGDLPLHLHFISSFLFGNNLPPENPIFSGVPLRYPFFSDFYSALVWFVTGDMEWAVELPGLCMGLALIILLYQWIRRVTGSVTAGLLAPLLFLLSGGLGFWLWIKDMALGQITGLAHSYTIYPQEGLQWANTLYALFIPQRSMQFALPLVVFLLACLQENQGRSQRSTNLFIGLLAAPLPFIHGHAVIPLTIYSFVFFMMRPSWKWLYLIIPLALAWAPQILYLTQILGPQVDGAKGFLSIQPGWEAKDMTIVWFWLKNTGPFIPLIFIGLYFRKDIPGDILCITWASLLVFVLGNTVMFAPWSWDNIKILIFWFLGSLPMVCFLLASWIESDKKGWILIALGCIFFLIFSGSLDLTRALKKGGENHRILSKDDILIAEWIRENTPPTAIFLCQPTYNQPLVLTGRRMVLGYPGHIWSHGLPLEPRQRDVKEMMRGSLFSLPFMEDYGITHILMGNREKSGGSYNTEFWKGKMPCLYSTPVFSVFKVVSP